MPSVAGRRLIFASLGFAIIISFSQLPRRVYAQTTLPIPSASALPAPWVGQDIGNPAPSGSAGFIENRFDISASGTDASVNTDQIRFVYQMLSDDVRIAARVDSLMPAQMSSKAGLMIRGSLEPNAPQGSVLMGGDGELAFHSRKQGGGATVDIIGKTRGTVPQWLGLERRGARVVAYSSSDGQTWAVIGSDWIGPGAVYVGLAVSSQDPMENTIAQISQVSVSGLPVGQRQRNIGGFGVTGSALQTQGTYTIKSKSSDTISETQDKFHFVYQPMQGDLEVVARVASLNSVNPSAEAGVMIRESLRADSRHAFALIASQNGYAFDRRVESGLSSEHADGGAGAVPGWVRLVRSGTNFESFRSNDGLTWTSMGSTQIAMSDQVYVGLAVASQAANVETTAVLDHFSAGAATTAGLLPNLPPTVTLITPVTGSTFQAPATITLTALAADLEGRLTDVRFYADDTLIGAASTAPHTFTWSSVPAGSYTLTAVAADADGGTTTSMPVSITVQPAPNQPPTVALTAPVNGATFTAPATITLTASASDPENRLARVDFYRGSTQLGTATAAPYSFTWSSVAAGSYTLTAVAVDVDGGTKTSAAVSITVDTAPSTRRVAFTASTDHDTMVTSYLLEVFASGADVNTSSPIASTDLGKPTPDANRDITVDETTFFNALSPGSYSVTVSAIAPEGRARSAPVPLTR
jgi:Big-like domain-containing protein